MSEPEVHRILHVAPTPFFSDRGCHVRIRGLAKGLNALGINNRVCTYSIGRDVDDVDTVRCHHIPGYKKTAAGPSVFKFFMDPLLLFTVVRQIRKFQPDVLHCHLHEGLLIGWLAKFPALRPALLVGFDMQGSLTGELDSYGYLNNKVVRGVFRFLEKLITSMADIYYCSSPASARLLRDKFGVEAEKIVLAPDGSDVDFSREPEASRGRGERPIAIYTGGLVESKGLKELMEVIRESSNRQLELDFLIVGFPTDKLQQFVDQHELRNCRLTGQVPFDELAMYLSQATLCLEPKSGSTSEASGKLMNYMAAGLPVVCFDTSNSRELLGGSGYFASEPDAAAFVDQIESALADPVEAGRRGRAAGERAAKRYSWKASANKINLSYSTALLGEHATG